MFNFLDVVDPGVEDVGSSMNPFLMVGIIVGIILVVAAIILIVRKNSK